MDKKSVTLISIGDELLSGRTVNTNASYICEQLVQSGYTVSEIITIGDKKENIVRTMKSVTSKLVIITGGLGPTPDDITVEAVAEYLKRKTIVNIKLRSKIIRHMKAKDRNLIDKQSTVVSGAVLIDNKEGAAPAQIIKNDSRTILLIPGVPAEMKYLMTEYLKMQHAAKTLHREVIRLYGIYESAIMSRMQKVFPDSITEKVSFLPSLDYVDIVLYADKFSETERRKIRNILYALFHEHTAGKGETVLAHEIGKLFIKKGKTLAIAESCTGGLLSKMITDVGGSSGFFKGGIIAYADELKVKLLKVRPAVLKKHGAVSRETAHEMAENICRITGCDFGLSVTGIAGPKGGTSEKPVGTVFCAIHSRNKTMVYKYMFKGKRDSIRRQTASFILQQLLRRCSDE